jgi:hypothetical protein
MSKTENSYLKYSLPVLEHLAEDFAYKLGMGQVSLANGEDLCDVFEQVLDAIEQRRKTDFCKHGVFLYGDNDCACWQCELGE